MNGENLTISKLIEISANKFPDRELFVFPETGKRWTYKEFDNKVNEICNGLIKMGIKKGDHIGIWMDNIEEWYILFFAINRIGAISIPINTGFKSEEMGIILKNFDIDYLFMSEGYKSKYPGYINKIIPNFHTPTEEIPRLKKIITVNFKYDNCTCFDDLMGNNEKYISDGKSTDVCIIMPTSGTTGLPKGVELTNAQLLKNGYDIGEGYELDGNDKLLIQVPMFHCFGITLSMLASLTHFTKMIIISHFNSTKALEVIESEKITCINGVPTMYIAILNDNKFAYTNLESLKKGIMAGSNCLPDLMHEVSSKMGITIITVYGLTEASPGCTMTKVSDNAYIRENTVGKSFSNIECKVINPETGFECQNGEQGEFIVRGYNVMKGYYNNPVETAKVIDKNGFLHTGDLAVKNDYGYYTITGRIKDTIIRGGENIYPAEVENIINRCNGVISSCVFGVEDDIYGQEIKACIISDGSITEEEIKEYIREHSASYKVPRYIVFVDDFIKNAAGKVLVYKMKETY